MRTNHGVAHDPCNNQSESTWTMFARCHASMVGMYIAGWHYNWNNASTKAWKRTINASSKIINNAQSTTWVKIKLFLGDRQPFVRIMQHQTQMKRDGPFTYPRVLSFNFILRETFHITRKSTRLEYHHTYNHTYKESKPIRTNHKAYGYITPEETQANQDKPEDILLYQNW